MTRMSKRMRVSAALLFAFVGRRGITFYVRFFSVVFLNTLPTGRFKLKGITSIIITTYIFLIRNTFLPL